MRAYTLPIREQSYQLSALLEMGQTQTEIAKVIDAHKSTVNRELGRNRGQRGYRPSKLTTWL
jgi:IS30 family transposase